MEVKFFYPIFSLAVFQVCILLQRNSVFVKLKPVCLGFSLLYMKAVGLEKIFTLPRDLDSGFLPSSLLRHRLGYWFLFGLSVSSSLFTAQTGYWIICHHRFLRPRLRVWIFFGFCHVFTCRILNCWLSSPFSINRIWIYYLVFLQDFSFRNLSFIISMSLNRS